jgi:hypothetical protein
VVGEDRELVGRVQVEDELLLDMDPSLPPLFFFFLNFWLHTILLRSRLTSSRTSSMLSHSTVMNGAPLRRFWR